jgi:hypothetical protein
MARRLSRFANLMGLAAGTKPAAAKPVPPKAKAKAKPAPAEVERDFSHLAGRGPLFPQRDPDPAPADTAAAWDVAMRAASTKHAPDRS